MLSDDHITSTLQRVLASQQAIEGLRASVEKPRPKPLLPAEREMERWRVAAQIAQKLKMAGLYCQLSIPVRPH
jgi:hypothetical protein